MPQCHTLTCLLVVARKFQPGPQQAVFTPERPQPLPIRRLPGATPHLQGLTLTGQRVASGDAWNMAQVQKKTTTMSLTISSCPRESTSNTVVQQQRSSLVQPLLISPQRTQSPSGSQHYSGSGGVAPKFIKCLHDISTVKGQLVVLECRIRGTPPLQVLWYREDEQIMDSADFRILRKSDHTVLSFPPASRTTEELCTLVITEAYPEDSGMFKCVASNQFGSASCSALLEVYTGLDEVLAEEEISGESARLEPNEIPSFLLDTAGIPPPEWPDSPEEEARPPLHMCSDPQQIGKSSVEPCSSPDTCSPPPPAVQNKQPGGSMSVANLPAFSPSLYPPSAFNYERPRHFIQAQSCFQAPGYEGQQSNGSNKTSPSSSTLSSPVSTPVPPASPSRPPMRSSVTLIPKVSSGPPQRTSPVAFLCSVLPSQASPRSSSPGQTLATLPKSSAPSRSTERSVPLPSFSTSHSPPSPVTTNTSQPEPKMVTTPHLTSPPPCVSLPASYRGSNSVPKPVLKKATPRPVSRSTDEEIQGSKDALIQDLEKQLRNKEARRKNSQKLSYEERMARRLLGPDSAASVFDLENQPDIQPDQPDSPEGRRSGGIW
ncbi:myotilin isoform X1 [Arapaima gigas]